MKNPQAWNALSLRMEAGQDAIVPVQGTSMHPFLRQGDVLHIRKITADQLRLGDLMAFQRDGALIVHRFAGRVRREGAWWLRQKGDNVRGFSLVAEGDLVGRAEVLLRGGRRQLLTGRLARGRNRLLGLRAWGLCALWELARRTARLRHLGKTP